MNFEDYGSGLLQPCMATGKQRHTPIPGGFQIFRMLFSVTFIGIYPHKYRMFHDLRTLLQEVIS